ncbi:hypothetical protein [Streptomyces sp. NBC_01236]|uniref:hypothetical protein n=1 Tax=Streptomyces sp. NBC_01236 TaxID=2903789 RepID=UPI002E1649A9|nr:hypothetical protein OG324_22975 [Streptomyces sp. NBC_01236]
MTEQPTTPEPLEPVEPVDAVNSVPESVTPAPEPASEPAPAKKPVRRGRIAAIAGSVLLVGAVIGGTGYTVVTVQDADRDAGAPVWKFPKAAKKDAKTAKAASGLAAMLVPYETDGWSRGPDIAEFGSDAALSGGEATALRKESISGLPRTQRRRIEKQIDKQHTKGMVMRSYLSTSNATDSTLYADSAFTVSIELMQMEDKTAIKNMSTFQNELLDTLDIFRAGPKIKGHKNAKCFLPPKDKEEKLDMMVCSAYEGDVLVSVTAEAAKPLNTKGVASLLREQLDRIVEPGEAV